MVSNTLLVAFIAAQGVTAFPFVPRAAGVDSSLLHARQQPPTGEGSSEKCPFNPDHKGAVPFNPKYPYNNAKDGKPGNGKGGYKVPADGDVDHYFVAPDYSKDIRGPCPGINTMANHGFLSRDGITNFKELVDAQQNVYNVGFDLANTLAVLGLTTTDGDIVTERLSIGCDATKRTSFNPVLTGSQPGLNGHNKFEADSSLTRNDFFTHNGDNFKMNATLFDMMDKSTGSLFDFDGMSKYRYERYQQSQKENPNFYFGPLSLLLYGASSFLYELMPSGTRNYTPDLYTISSFFGAEKVNGQWTFNGKERIPDNWTNRVDPYTDMKVGAQIFKQYLAYPVLFGGNTADGSFDGLTGVNGLLEGGKLSSAVNETNMACFVYMLSTERIPTSLNSVVTPSVQAIAFALSKLNPGFKNLGCPMPLS